VPTPSAYDYALIRVVPRVERQEFVNVGVVLSCPVHDFLESRIHLDPARLRALDPTLDLELIARHLRSFQVICRGGPEALAIGRLSPRERFHWLVAPRSTVIQTSPVHMGQCASPADALDHLMRTMVLPPLPRPAPPPAPSC
jgi:hypothetical protein